FIERQHGSDHQDATGTFVVVGAGPYFSPGYARDEILKFFIEGGFLRIGTINPGVAKHLAAPGHAMLVALLVVHGFPPDQPRRNLSTVSGYCFGCSTFEIWAASRLARFAPGIAF